MLNFIFINNFVLKGVLVENSEKESNFTDKKIE